MTTTPRSTSTTLHTASILPRPRRPRPRPAALVAVGALVLAGVGGTLGLAAPASAATPGPTTGITASFALWSAGTGSYDVLTPDADGVVQVPHAGDFVDVTATPVDANGTATGDAVQPTFSSDGATDAMDSPYSGDTGVEFRQDGLHHVTLTADGFSTDVTVEVGDSTATPPTIDASSLPQIHTSSTDVVDLVGYTGHQLPAVAATSDTPTTFRIQFLPDQAQALPDGIGLDPDGTFSGTTQDAASARVLLTATNAAGASTVLLYIDVEDRSAEVLQESLQGMWGDQPTYTADSDGISNGPVEVPAAGDQAIVSGGFVARPGTTGPSDPLSTVVITSSDPSDAIDVPPQAGFTPVTFGTPGRRVLTLVDGPFVARLSVVVAGPPSAVSVAVTPQWDTSDHATARVGDTIDIASTFTDAAGTTVATPSDVTVRSDVAADTITTGSTPSDAVIVLGAAGTHTITVSGGGVSTTTTIHVDPVPTPPAPPCHHRHHGHHHRHHHHGR